MLLCVTATSMAAVIDCKDPASQVVVGDFAPPADAEVHASVEDAGKWIGRIAEQPDSGASREVK